MKTSKRKPSSYPRWFVNLTQVFRNVLIKTERRMVPPQIAVLEMALHFMVSRAVWAAAELNIAEHLREGPLSVDELAKLTGTDSEALYRLLRLLSEHEVFRQVRPRIFKLTALSAVLLNESGSIRPMIRFVAGNNYWEPFSNILYSLQTGNSAVAKNSKDSFAELEKAPELHSIFNDAMTALSELTADAILAAYDFSRCETVIDIGGGQGILLSEILKRHANCNGILFDLPQVIKKTTVLDRFPHLSSRLKLQVGDFFKAIPTGGDTYILKNIVHDWDDAHAAKMLEQIYRAMDSESKLLIIETPLTNTNRRSYSALFDVLMLVSVDGGKERTKKEYVALLSQADFQVSRILPTGSAMVILECKKRKGCI